jgi:glutaminyl-peptide cyclotransferase
VGRTCLYATYLLIAVLCACGAGTTGPPAEYTYQIVNTYPHDPQAFTQGLEYHGGYLYESTGQNGHSWVRKVALDTGTVLQQVNLSEAYFGEGITISDNRVIELTWQSGKGFIYDLERFQLLKTFTYTGEGWGLTHDGGRIYMSDGTPQLRIWNASTLGEESRITVRDRDQLVPELNELEFIKGEIYANVWQTDRIARISPSDGRVTGWIDCSGLLSPEERQHTDVLNGIAYDAGHDRLFVTGKLWPKLFEIKLIPKKE